MTAFTSSAPASFSATSSSTGSYSRASTRQRISTACNYCRHRRIKCSGGERCNNCSRTGRACCYTAITEETNQDVKDRKAIVKAAKASGRAPPPRSIRGVSVASSCEEVSGWAPAPVARPFPSVLVCLASPMDTSSVPSSPTFSSYSSSSSSGFSSLPITPGHSEDSSFDWSSPPPTPMLESSPFEYTSHSSPFGLDYSLASSPSLSATASCFANPGLGFSFPSSFEPSMDLPVSSFPIYVEELSYSAKMDQFSDAPSPAPYGGHWLAPAPQWTESAQFEEVEVYEEIYEELSVWGWGN